MDKDKDINEKVKGYLPITIIRTSQEDRGDRIASTIRHNRARGKHKVEGMSEMVLELKRISKFIFKSLSDTLLKVSGEVALKIEVGKVLGRIGDGLLVVVKKLL